MVLVILTYWSCDTQLYYGQLWQLWWPLYKLSPLVEKILEGTPRRFALVKTLEKPSTWKQVLLFCMDPLHGEFRQERSNGQSKKPSAKASEKLDKLRCWKTARKKEGWHGEERAMIWWQSFSLHWAMSQGFFKMLFSRSSAGVSTSKLWSCLSQNLWWRKVNGDPYKATQIYWQLRCDWGWYVVQRSKMEMADCWS